MLKIIVLIKACLLIVFYCAAQDSFIEKGDTITYFYSNNKIKSEGALINKKRQGVWHFFSEEGKLKCEIEYRNDNKDGYSRFYNPITSKMISEGNYVHDDKEGEWRFYYLSGQLKSTENYLKNTLHGRSVSYDSVYGIKETECTFSKANKNGEFREYYLPSGKLKKTLQYVDDILNGEAMYYDSLSGVKTSGGRFKNGLWDGEWTFYFPPSGTLKATEVYSNGVLKSGIYYDSILGSKKSSGNYLNGVEEGEWIYFYSDSKTLKQKSIFKDGKKTAFDISYDSSTHSVIGKREYKDSVIIEWLFNANGSLKNIITYNRQEQVDGPFIQYDSATGNVTYKVSLKDSIRYGTAEYYNSFGKLIMREFIEDNDTKSMAVIYDTLTGSVIGKGEYINSKKEGDWLQFSKVTGKLSMKEHYVGNELNGASYEYDINAGNIIRKLEMRNDTMQGEETLYYSSGAKMQIALYKENMLDGEFNQFDSTTGAISVKGNYVKNERNGEWSYYQNKKSYLDENYKNGLLEGKSIAYDSNGNIRFEMSFSKGKRQGKCIVYTSKKKKQLELDFVNDFISGIVKTYFESGKIKRNALYENGRMIYDTCFTENGAIADYVPFWIEPKPQEDPATYIGANLKYPEEALKNRLEGKVLIQFTINEFGKIEEPMVIKSIGYECDREALRLISQMPDWEPLQVDGIPYRITKTLPVVFWIRE